MRLAITGHKGQLGRALQERVRGHELLLLDMPEHDITQGDTIVRTIVEFAPEVVIHGAAFTNVDAAACDPELALRVNGLGTQNVATACHELSIPMLYVSTNEVFDGTASQPYLETDDVNPINAYARSKLVGEQHVRDLSNAFYIVRTAWLYGPGGNHFVRKICRAADERGRVSVVTDEVASPTYALDLAEAIVRLTKTGAFGVYHFTNAGICSRYEFAREILLKSGRGHVPVEPITSGAYQRPSKPPPYSPLANTRGAALGIELRAWQAALEEYLRVEPQR